MKARARQRTFFNKQVEPNVCVLEPIRFTPESWTSRLLRGDRDDERAFWNQFEKADILRGSLIRPRSVAERRNREFRIRWKLTTYSADIWSELPTSHS